MNAKRFLAGLLTTGSVLMLCACATDESAKGNKYFAEAPPKDEIICRRERPIGSHVPVRVCRSVRDVEEGRRRALEAVGPLRTMSGDLPRPPPTRPSNPN